MKDLQELTAPFAVYERAGAGNMKYKYIKSRDIIARMIDYFGLSWSTSVLETKIVDDYIVVHVKVSVTIEGSSKSEDREFSHDGYGTDLIKRFSSGAKQGQIIDLGNAYKSAESKAIAHACSRFGVGLFLDESDDSESGSPVSIKNMESPFKSTIPSSMPSPVVSSMPKETGVLPKDVPQQVAQVPSMPAFDTPSVQTSNILFPPFSVPGSTGIATQSNSTSTTQSMSAIPTMPSMSTPSMSGDTKVNDIQKAAIESLMSTHSVPYEKFVSSALSIEEADVPSIDNLTYKQGVLIIKYGNDVRTKPLK